MSASASIIASCDALVTYLNAIQTPPAPPVTVPPTPAAVNPFDPFTFTAYRDYAPYFQLTEMGTLHVVVCPRDKDTGKMEGRNSWLQDDGIDIGIMIKPANLDPTADRSAQLAIIDPLMLLVEQIHDLTTFQDFDGCGWIKTQNVPVYSAEHLRGWKQFTSVLRLTLRSRRIKA